jgi:uncharacterized repeat protein (TIGR03837 family)
MSSPLSWDIFCHVVDNFGDIGVCWRLARRLVDARGATVRLWVDDLASLHLLCPQVDPKLARQDAERVEIRHWGEPFPSVTPSDVAVEAFGCGLPDAYVIAMVARSPRPLWITLEYLSAEAWVREHHRLPSPPPRRPLARYFFFPGFTPDTGGVLREPDLLRRRDAFGDSERARLWKTAGFDPPPAGATVVSLFAYEHAPVAKLLAAWEHGGGLTVAAVPEGRIVGPVLDFLGAARPGTGRTFRRGQLEVRILPFVAQPRYDDLLWACDCNFVRGEDSFVRAQWAARPLVWQPYFQQEGAHRAKLEAFLDLYCAGLSGDAARALRGLWRAWNAPGDAPVQVDAAWTPFWAHRGALDTHARTWAGRLDAAGELAEKLAQFCQDKLK